jgi:hypothetical protein
MGLDNNWVRNLHWIVDWEWHFDFLDNWDFNLLVNWILFNVMVVDCVHVIWNGNLDVFAGKKS